MVIALHWSQATEMARYMVTQCGFNDVVGPMYFADEAGKGLSEETRRKVWGRGMVDEGEIIISL